MKVKDVIDALAPYDSFKIVDKFGQELTPKICIDRTDMSDKDKEIWRQVIPYLHNYARGFSIESDEYGYYVLIYAEKYADAMTIKQFLDKSCICYDTLTIVIDNGIVFNYGICEETTIKDELGNYIIDEFNVQAHLDGDNVVRLNLVLRVYSV